MKTIDIKGKPYVCVNERIKEFRAQYPDWSLESELVSVSEETCIIKATIKNEDGIIKATGYAQEDRNNKMSMVNKTSYIENCETSAWGRALGNLGIGIDASIASAEEVITAIASQNNIPATNNPIPPIKSVTDDCVTSDGDYVLTSGKYQGSTIRKVHSIDKGYLDFIVSKNFEPTASKVRGFYKEIDDEIRNEECPF